MTIDALAYVTVTAALVLMIMGFAFRRPELALGASLAWVGLAAVCYGASTAAWDAYYIGFWLTIAMIIVSALEALALRSPAQEEPPENPNRDWDAYLEDIQSRRERMDKLRAVRRRR